MIFYRCNNQKAVQFIDINIILIDIIVSTNNRNTNCCLIIQFLTNKHNNDYNYFIKSQSVTFDLFDL